MVNQIFNENCLDTMKKMDNQSVDMVITSPPYNMNLRIRKNQKTGKREFISRQITKETSNKYYNSGFNDNMPINDFYEFHKKVIFELLRVSPIVFYNIQIVTGSKQAFFKLIGDFAENLKEIIVLDKKNASPAILSGVLSRHSELVLVFESDKNEAISRQFKNARFERGTLKDVWIMPRSGKITIDDIEHSATFSPEFVKTIINNFTKEGALIYDPFSGLATTAIACMETNRHYIGSEINPYFYQQSLKRIEQNTKKVV